MTRAQKVYKEPYCARNSCRQLAKECVSGVDICALAVLRAQQAALLLVFIRIVTGKQRREVLVPLVHEVETALLDPSIEILLRDGVRVMEDRILRREDGDGCF